MRLASAAILAATFSTPVMAAPDWTKIDQALGRSGATMPGDVHRYGFPRSDLHVTLDGVTLLPALALGGWLAFQAEGDSAMTMGDLVLTENEINPVMSKLLAGGVRVTALHNHVIRAQPVTFYMHVEGHGDATQLATQFTIGFNDKTLFSVTDRTFVNAGKVALWTKADSVTRFDNLTIQALA